MQRNSNFGKPSKFWWMVLPPVVVFVTSALTSASCGITSGWLRAGVVGFMLPGLLAFFCAVMFGCSHSTAGIIGFAAAVSVYGAVFFTMSRLLRTGRLRYRNALLVCLVCWLVGLLVMYCVLMPIYLDGFG